MRLLFYISLWICAGVHAQTAVTGYVIEEFGGKRYALGGAMVRALQTGIAATTNEDGYFQLEVVNVEKDILITSATGYQTDTTALRGSTQITITLRPIQLAAVEVSVTRKEISIIRTESITDADLVKDACCNLSESFENSATVDVSYADAISGAKEIRMLGLDGVYTQMMTENIPSIRTLGSAFGLQYLPGPWLNSIQVNKGVGSVVNGYEGIIGQINSELKKPLQADKLFVNFFLNQDVRSELNIIGRHHINESWSYLGALHGFYNWLRMDMNHDHYIDNPLIKNLNVLNRVHRPFKRGGMFALAHSLHLEDRLGGSMHFSPKLRYDEQNHFGMRLQTIRSDLFAKTGIAVSDEHYTGIQYKYNFHRHRGFVGRRAYEGTAHFGYLNLILQHEINETHLLKTGMSFQTDWVREKFDTVILQRVEYVPGVFAEGTFYFGEDERLTLIAGGRVDYHNLFGVLPTPRVHLQWNILHDLEFRAGAGRGYRVPTLFAENFGWLANNRSISVDTRPSLEEAWNYGASLTYNFLLNNREGSISADYYYTDFIRQVVPDIEEAGRLQFYTKRRGSTAHVAQLDVKYEPVNRFEVKASYKFERNMVNYRSGKKIYPFRPQHRGLLSLQYTTPSERWRFNSSFNLFGPSRVPDYRLNGGKEVQQGKSWVQWNAQITLRIRQWEVYLGGDNLLNFIQKNPIVMGEQPLHPQFDASMIWGPLRGAMAFAGFRWVMKENDK
ncbi:MAG: TonB-dependent receptor [Chitinophagales bacterium]|nr:TonB-dependent receptor [Chitinophagales bacterium]MDW8419310.1 TonB-dependent receptor [Chitinophagales bacterium]